MSLVKEVDSVVFGMVRLLLRERGPDTAVVRRDREWGLLKGHDGFQPQLAAMQLFDVVTSDREPEWYGLVAIRGVDRYQRVLRPAVPCVEEDTPRQVAVPVVEEKVRPLSHVLTLLADAEQPPDERHQLPADIIVEEVPTARTG